MASIPFWLRFTGVIAAGGGTATVSYAVPMLQTLTIDGLTWTSTGLFGIYSMHNSNGRIYTNASQAAPLLNTHLQQGGSPNIGWMKFPTPLEIKGGDIFYIDLLDMSAAANTINLILPGTLDLGGS